MIEIAASLRSFEWFAEKAEIITILQATGITSSRAGRRERETSKKWERGPFIAVTSNALSLYS